MLNNDHIINYFCSFIYLLYLVDGYNYATIYDNRDTFATIYRKLMLFSAEYVWNPLNLSTVCYFNDFIHASILSYVTLKIINYLMTLEST